MNISIRHFNEEHYTEWNHVIPLLQEFQSKLKERDPNTPSLSHWMTLLVDLYNTGGTVSILYEDGKPVAAAMVGEVMDFHYGGKVDSLYGLVGKSHTGRLLREVCRYRISMFGATTLLYTQHKNGLHINKSFDLTRF